MITVFYIVNWDTPTAVDNKNKIHMITQRLIDDSIGLHEQT